jgi:glycosyltransferase involved in cell wall biosynthesis
VRVLELIQEMQAGGAERVVLAVSAGATAAGHTTAVAAAPGPWDDSLSCVKFDLPLIRRRPASLLVASTRLRGIVQRWRPDIVHCHNPTMAIVGAFATGRGARVPAVVSVHGVPDEDYRAAARILKHAALPVVACGPGVADALSEHGVRMRATIVNGVGPPPLPADRTSLLAEWRLAPDVALVASVGRLVPQKNHALVMRAIARLSDVSLAVVGDGRDRAKLEGLRSSLGLADRVAIVGRRDDAPAIVAAADVVVLGSHWEGLPLVALEAMTARTPIVATRVRGIRELVRHDTHGLLVPPDDPIALADALRHVLENGALRRRLTARAAELASAFTVEAMVSRYLDLFSELVGARAATSSRR